MSAPLVMHRYFVWNAKDGVIDGGRKRRVANPGVPAEARGARTSLPQLAPGDLGTFQNGLNVEVKGRAGIQPHEMGERPVLRADGQKMLELLELETDSIEDELIRANRKAMIAQRRRDLTNG